MLQSESVIAVFGEHQEADDAVKKLMHAGIAMENLSIVGKGYHAEEKIVGFYNIGDRMKFWGKRGVLWGSLWGLFMGGVSLTLPGIGQIMVLGYLAAIVVSAVEGAIMLGGLSALGAALYSAGIPRDSILQYEQAVKADGFLVIVHGAVEELARARAILALGNPSRLDLHDGPTTSLSGSLPIGIPANAPISRTPPGIPPTRIAQLARGEVLRVLSDPVVPKVPRVRLP